jgi:hypothetical protein
MSRINDLSRASLQRADGTLSAWNTAIALMDRIGAASMIEF